MDRFKGYLVGRTEILVEFQMCREEQEENGLCFERSFWLHCREQLENAGRGKS